MKRSVFRRSFATFAWLLTVLVASSAHADCHWDTDYYRIAPDHLQHLDDAKIFRVNLSDLHPGQFTIGMGEVRWREKYMNDLSKDKFCDEIKDHVKTVVIGPNNIIWLIDGHHMAVTLNHLHEDEMLVKVEKNWSKLGEAEFFKRMIDAGYLWLYDADGNGPLDPSKLPIKLSDLKDDEYRDLAWEVRRAGGFRKTAVPFAEFIWGAFFRKKFTPEELHTHHAEVVKKAAELAHTPEASSLPGYSKNPCEVALEDKS